MPSSAEILQTLRNQSYQLHPDFTRQEDLRRDLRDVAAELALNLYGSQDLATHALLDRRDPKVYDTPPDVEQDAEECQPGMTDPYECSPGDELRSGVDILGRKYQEVWEIEAYIYNAPMSAIQFFVLKSPNLVRPLAINGEFSASVQPFLNGKIKPLDSSDPVDPVVLLKPQEELGSRFARLIIFDPDMKMSDDGAFDAVIFKAKPSATLTTIKRKVRWYTALPTDEHGGRVDFVLHNTTSYHRIPHRSLNLGVMKLDLVIGRRTICSVFAVGEPLAYHIWADLNEPFPAGYHLSGMPSKSAGAVTGDGDGDGDGGNDGNDGGDNDGDVGGPKKRQQTGKEGDNTPRDDGVAIRPPDGVGPGLARRRVQFQLQGPRQFITNGILRRVPLNRKANR